MIVRVTMKTPSAVDDCIDEYLPLLYEDDEEVLDKRDELNDLLSKWFKYGEYLTVEVDTTKKTCKVVPV